MIDDIYLIIEDHCKQEGVSEVPVVFEWIGVPIEDIAEVDGSDVNESNDANLSNNEKKIVGNETTNQMPGFTSIMGILGLLSLLIIKHSI